MRRDADSQGIRLCARGGSADSGAHRATDGTNEQNPVPAAAVLPEGNRAEELAATSQLTSQISTHMSRLPTAIFPWPPAKR